MKHFFLVCVLILSIWHTAVAAETTIEVKGLFKGAAVLVINGKQQLIKVGKRSSDGILLVSSDSKHAVIEVDGMRKQLSLSQTIGTAYSQSDVREVRLTSQHQGHFFGSARINGRSVQFIVDTGASTISMSSVTAEKIGVPYLKGRVTRVATAQGTTRGFQVTLRKVEVGGISMDNVAAIIIEGEYPLDVLLGNSFLSPLEMNIDNGVMVLKQTF